MAHFYIEVHSGIVQTALVQVTTSKLKNKWITVFGKHNGNKPVFCSTDIAWVEMVMIFVNKCREWKQKVIRKRNTQVKQKMKTKIP